METIFNKPLDAQVASLNDAITNLAQKTYGTGTKESSSISDVEMCKWKRVGSICIVNFKFTTSAAITNSSEKLFSGFPQPYISYALAYAHSVTSITGGEIRLRLGSDGAGGGALFNGYTPNSIPAGQWEGFVVYITNS